METTTKKPRAYSYLRFSTPEQMKGDSFRRQMQMAVEYARRHGLELDDKLTFQDLGVSAYRGRNAEAGRLADFLAAVENGTVPQGSYLLVESLDRVSRTTPRRAVRLLERICEAGVNVVTLSDGKVYNVENLDTDGGMSLIMSVLIFVRANEESAMKSRRLKAAWDSRREELSKGKPRVVGRAPAWLRIEDGEYKVVDDKAEVVRRLFALASQGYGTPRIAQILNDEGVPPLVPSGKRWYQVTVRHYLTNRAVLGEYQPHVIEYIDGKRTRKPVGDPIKIYPQIISEELFESVQRIREANHRVYGEGPPPVIRRHPGSVNIFAGLGICSLCGDSMTLQTKGSRGRKYRYLVCVNARYGQGCKYHAVRLDYVTDSFFRDLDVILSNPPAADETTQDELESLWSPITALEDTIASLVEAYEKVPDPAILSRITEIRGELTVLREREKALRSLLANTTGPVVDRRIQALLDAVKEDPEDRPRIAQCISQLFSGISIDPIQGVALLAWRGGGTSGFVFRPPLVQKARKGA